MNLIDEWEDTALCLVDLVYKLRAFTEEEIIKELKNTCGRETLGPFRSIKGFLQELVEDGILEYDDFRYSLPSR